MTHRLITAPTVEPVTIAEAGLHCRIDCDLENALLSSLIAAARQHIEAYTGRALVTQTWELRAQYFPDAFELPRAPVQSITSVSYVDIAGVTQTLPGDQYTLIADIGPHAQPGRMVPAYLATWPACRGYEDDVRVRYVAGYGNGQAVPQPIRAAMLLLIGHLYENREAVITGTGVNDLPLGVAALLAPYKVF